MLMQASFDKGFLNENTSSASSIFGSMNGSIYASPALGEPIINPNHNSISPIKSSPLLDVDITAVSPTSNGGQYHQSHLTQNQGPLHIPAKRLANSGNPVSTHQVHIEKYCHRSKKEEFMYVSVTRVP